MSEIDKLNLIEEAGKTLRARVVLGTGKITDYQIRFACKNDPPGVAFVNDKTVMTVSYTLEYSNAT